MPTEVVARLNTTVARVLADPAVAARLIDAGATPAPTTPARFAAQIDTEVSRWQQVIRTAGLKLQ